MRTQIRRLIEIASLPSVTLRVLPLSVGEHAAMSGAFTVYRFAERTNPDVVYLEHTTSDLYVDSPEQVERHSAAFDHLRTAAMNPGRSTSFLEVLVDNLD